MATRGGFLTIIFGLVCYSILCEAIFGSKVRKIMIALTALFDGGDYLVECILSAIFCAVYGTALIICGIVMLGYENSGLKGTDEYFRAIDVCLRVIVGFLFFLLTIIISVLAVKYIKVKNCSCAEGFLMSIAGSVVSGCFVAGIMASLGKMNACI